MTVHTENEALFQRASRCLAGGVLSNFKKAKGVAPVYVKSAEGCRMTDYDGNVYYDFSLSAVISLTPLIDHKINFKLLSSCFSFIIFRIHLYNTNIHIITSDKQLIVNNIFYL